MWCTRWYIPLLLFPFPKTQPFFLVVFLISLTLHARPCFYCMILLAALLTSSCYWQPLPLDAPLTVPFNGSSTFGEALAIANLSLPEPLDVPLPSTVKLLDRCWCSLQNGRLFEPFDVSKWERWSVDWTLRELRVKNEKEKAAIKAKEDAEKAREAEISGEIEDGNGDAVVTMDGATSSSENVKNELIPISEVSLSPDASSISSRPFSLERLRNLVGFTSHQETVPSTPNEVPLPSTENFSAPTGAPNATDLALDEQSANKTSATEHPSLSPLPESSPSVSPLPLFRREYDLRPYGVNMIFDFGWESTLTTS